MEDRLGVQGWQQAGLYVKTKTKPTKTRQQMENEGCIMTTKITLEMSPYQVTSMCLRTKGGHRNCVREEPFHRTGAETGGL